MYTVWVTVRDEVNKCPSYIHGSSTSCCFSMRTGKFLPPSISFVREVSMLTQKNNIKLESDNNRSNLLRSFIEMQKGGKLLTSAMENINTWQSEMKVKDKNFGVVVRRLQLLHSMLLVLCTYPYSLKSDIKQNTYIDPQSISHNVGVSRLDHMHAVSWIPCLN